MIRAIISLYRPSFTKAVVYMLQATEYQLGPYLDWFWRTSDFNQVMHRRRLVMTKKAKLLTLVVGLGILIQQLASLAWLISSIHSNTPADAGVAIALFIIAPIIWAHLIVLPLLLGDRLLTKPYMAVKVRGARPVFKKHRAVRVAVAGSYGKTTMKEILRTVLSEAKKVAATPANKNVAFAHAQFAKSLAGDEDVLIIEYGEGAPGDVPKFIKNTQPDYGFITGLVPAHLDKYKTLEAAGKDIFSLAEFLGGKKVFVNAESPAVKGFLKAGYQTYDRKAAAGWKISDLKSTIQGVSLKMSRSDEHMNIHSKLIGAHQVGPLAAAAALAIELGLSPNQVEAGVAKVQPFEHRMQPRAVSGAWIVDDTYNGNIDGMLAGLALLKDLPAKRKIYVTPGLVDQGEQTAKIHQQLGAAIAAAKPNLVVLMKHSVTDDITAGLNQAGFKGELMIEEDPLNFYNNLDQIIAAGDLVLLQNDWPDNYS